MPTLREVIMKIVVLNGSPKGTKSVTNGYIEFMEKKLDMKFDYINIGQRIKRISKNRELFHSIMSNIKKADAIIWSTPVYYFTVPSQVVEFINLVHENEMGDYFEGKLSTYITTSIRFFDNTAKQYLERVTQTLKMENYTGLQFKMYDLEKSSFRDLLTKFGKNFIKTVGQSRVLNSYEVNNSQKHFNYVAVNSNKIATDKKITVLADYNDSSSNIYKMVDGFIDNFKNKLDVVDINTLDIKTGCLGCCKCGWDNSCPLNGSDDHNSFFMNSIDSADIIICAPELNGDFFSYKWKRFLDRNFFVNHAPRLKDRQFAWIISGDISNKQYIIDTIDGWAQNNRSNLCDIVTDSSDDSAYISRKIDSLAKDIITYSESDYIKPNNFIGVGGSKVFRDEVFANIRFPFRIDHKEYKKIGYYNFPHRNIKMRIKGSVMLLLCHISAIRQQIFGNTNIMVDSTYDPIRKILEKA